MCCCAALLGILGAVWLGKGAILRGAARLLIVEDPLVRPDYVWSCEADGAYDRAGALLRKNPKLRILIVENHPNRLVQAGVLPNGEEVARRQFIARGVPRGHIEIIPGEACNNRQEVRLMAQWLTSHREKQVLVLCDRFHSRYQRSVFDRLLQPEEAAAVRIQAVPDRRFDETNWWKSRIGAKELFRAYVVLALAHCRCGDPDEPIMWNPEEYEQRFRRTLGGDCR